MSICTQTSAGLSACSPEYCEGLFLCLVEAAHGILPGSLASSAPHSSFPQHSGYRFPQKLDAHLPSRSSSLLLSFPTLPRSPTTLFCGLPQSKPSIDEHFPNRIFPEE